jgi:hypothetical protein
MNDYINEAFNSMNEALRNLILIYDVEIVAWSLMQYYKMVAKPDKVDNSSDVLEPDYELMAAIDRVLQDYLPSKEYDKWRNNRANATSDV